MENILNQKKDQEIIFSKSVKAGKRIYYLDVKRSRNDDLFLAITESKKRVTGTDDDLQVSFQKHKIFLYKEDFSKFTEALHEVINFIDNVTAEDAPTAETQDDVFQPNASKVNFDFDIDL